MRMEVWVTVLSLLLAPLSHGDLDTEVIRADEGLSSVSERIEVNGVKENFLTGGHGHRLTSEEATKYPEGTEIPKAVIAAWFKEDTRRAGEAADRLIKKHNLEDAPPLLRQLLAEMVFQMGATGTAKFKDTIALLKEKRYEEASVELLDSDWAKQTPARAQRASDRMRTLAK